MKQSNSGLFQNMKTSCFNSFILGDNSPQGTFDRSKEKISMLEFELEHNKDIIINLRRELISKNKEISLLKVNNNKRNEECQRTVRVIQEILKQCDPSTVAGFTTIDNSIQFNSEKNNDTKNKNNNNLPQIGNMLHFSSHHKKRFKEIIQVQMLKQQINSLNEELAKKNEEISQLKKSKNATNFTKLQNNFLKNFNELSKVKKENEFMKSKIEDVAHLYISQKENNFILKTRLQDFKGQFKDYKNSTVKKTNELKSLLLKAKKRERECKIFHLRKGKSMSALGSGPWNRNRNKNTKNERYDNSYDLVSDENNQKLNEETEKMNKTMSLLKRETNNRDLEIKSLKIEKNNLHSKINELQNQINQLFQKNISLDKQLQEVNNKKKFVEKDIKQQAIGANDIIKNLEKDNEDLKNLNKNLQNKIDEKERQLEEEKNKTVSVKDLLKEQENLNKNLNKKIDELQKQIEVLQQEINNNKDDTFLTGAGIKIFPHNEESKKDKYSKENNNKIEQKDKNDKSSINNSKKNNYIDNKDRNDINKKEEEDDKESYKFDDNENFENNKSNNDNKKKDSKNDELEKSKNKNKSEKSSSKILPLLIDKIVYSNNSLKLKENEKQEELENIDDIKKNKNYDNISSKKNANEDDIDDRIFENY